jgi:chromate transporter
MRFEQRGTVWEVFLAALKLGLTSFGGPVAHVGYFRSEYVDRRRWLDERTFGDLMALCQFLPGPASSQLGMAIGMGRAGRLGAVAAWLGFTLPSAIVMMLFALWLGAGTDVSDAGWLRGLKLTAVAVVAQAVWSMAQSLAPDRPRATIALAAAGWAVLVPGIAGQLAPLAVSAAIGYWLLRPTAQAAAQPAAPTAASQPTRRGAGRTAALLQLGIFAALLMLLPAASQLLPQSQALALADSHYRVGSLVFGGGHVVLPMLEAEVAAIGGGSISSETFMAGYGAAQAMPGPLFTFAAFIGGAAAPGWLGAVYAAVALVAIFVPSYLLLAGSLPFWSKLRDNRLARGALNGVNAAVVGILLAALYDPVWTDTVASEADFAFVLAAFLLLQVWKRAPWQVVVLSALGGLAIWP